MDVLCAYPDHNKPFHIYTDSSDYQMGSVIMQNGKPVAFWSKKLNPAQQNYTTREKELLSIVETLKEFRSMLLGAELHVHTDHKNLTFEKYNTQRVLRWRCYVEEFGPKLHFLPGRVNVIADNMSRLTRLDHIPTEKVDGETETAVEDVDSDDIKASDNETSAEGLESFYNVYDDIEVVECMLNLPPMNSPMENPLNYAWMKQQQDADQSLQRGLQRHPDLFFTKTLDESNSIICYAKTPLERESHWRIALAADMVKPTCDWFHQVLGHPGEKRLSAALQARYYHP